MSHSIEKRSENKEYALRLMATKAEDQVILTTTFCPSEPDFATAFPTTWSELEEASLVRLSSPKGAEEYCLTGAGWLKGLCLSDRWGADEFRKKAGKLSKTLKGYIKPKNREQEACVLLTAIRQASGLSDGFVYNAIESHLLRSLFDMTDARWDVVKSHVIIPSTFGLPI